LYVLLGPTGFHIDDGEDDDEALESHLDRQAQYAAMQHLQPLRDNDDFDPNRGSMSFYEHGALGEGKDLGAISFLTDPNPNEGDGSEGSSNESLDSSYIFATGQSEVQKSAVQNSKGDYDIRNRAGFFSKKKSHKTNSIDISGPLIFPKEFSPPSSAQSRRLYAQKEAEEIAHARDTSHPRSNVHVARDSGSR
jgi:hypothetical protein